MKDRVSEALRPYLKTIMTAKICGEVERRTKELEAWQRRFDLDQEITKEKP